MKAIDFIVHIFIHLVKKLKLGKLVYKLYPDKTLKIDSKNVVDARKLLESYSPNPQTSCFCRNSIDAVADVHFIIPAYNVEEYIENCLDSVVKYDPSPYTYHITVINDGSTDKTAEILEKYKRYPSVEIVTQENKGFSGARNEGLKTIKGKYICFLDSDDCLDWNGVKKLLDVAIKNGAEVVGGSHTTINANGEKKRFYKRSAGKEDIPSKLGGQPWAKIFKAELFADICFPEKYWYEDSILAQIVYPRVKCAYKIEENTYFYRVHSGSISHTGRHRAKSVDSYWITERLFYERQNNGYENTPDYYNYILRMVKLTFSRIVYQPSEIKEGVFVLFCDFIDRNFKGFSTDDNSLKEIESYIRTNNYGKCVAYSKWM